MRRSPVVVDASLLVAALSGEENAPLLLDRLAAHELHAPYLIDLEIANAMRRSVLGNRITVAEAEGLLMAFLDLVINRHSHFPLVARVWELRDNFTTYDAAYVALAELLGVPLLTRDARMSRATGHRVTIELVG